MLVSAGALLLLALPALQMHTKLPNLTDLPHDLKIVRTYDRLQQAFPGSQTPAVVVVKAPRVDTPEMQRAYALFRQRAVASGKLFAPFTVSMNPDKTVARIDFAIAGNGDDKASFAALHTLRDEVIPPIAQTLPGTEVAVTGVTAGTYDFNHQMLSRLPWVFLFVLGLAFSLLLLTFRSLVIAATAVVLNLLSVGAAYGILVAVFQHGWFAGPLGFQTNGAVVSWLPLFLFVVLFGLSMDYHVFILSRIKELHDAGATTDDAIRLGITRTAGTVTSAAIIMVAVFGLFASLSLIMMQQMGFGLAIAVLIDATVVRAVLVPSTMKLLGEWNWYLPRWLEWLPTVTPRASSHRHHPGTRYRPDPVAKGPIPAFRRRPLAGSSRRDASRPLLDRRRLIMLHLFDCVEERLHQRKELAERRAATKTLLVAVDGVPLDSHDVAIGILDAAGDLVAEAVPVGGERSWRRPDRHPRTRRRAGPERRSGCSRTIDDPPWSTLP